MDGEGVFVWGARTQMQEVDVAILGRIWLEWRWEVLSGSSESRTRLIIGDQRESPMSKRVEPVPPGTQSGAPFGRRP